MGRYYRGSHCACHDPRLSSARCSAATSQCQRHSDSVSSKPLERASAERQKYCHEGATTASRIESMPTHETDREPAKCRRHEMSIDWPQATLRAPLGAARAIAGKYVAPPGLNRLVNRAFYKYSAPTALETAKDSLRGEARAVSKNRF